MKVREEINKLNREGTQALIRAAIKKYPAGFDPPMLEESRDSMIEYLFDLDNSILEPLYLANS
ncbi:hypothetical protein ES705_33078 [subsurface metagenome]